MSIKRYNFHNRKSVHIHLTLGNHAEFRTTLLKKGITMQDALEACAIKIAEGNTWMEKMLDEVVEKKIKGELQIAAAEADSIYELIQKDDPANDR